MRHEITHSYPTIEDVDIRAVEQCLRSHQITAASAVDALQERVASDMGYSHALATVSASHALHLALRGRFPEGNASIGLPSYLCRTVYDAVVLAGCRPVLLDIDIETCSVSLKQAIERDLDAVLVAHLFGIRAPVEDFLEAGLTVIEDCAQRLAPPEARNHEPRPHIRILSFSATKIITGAEGGMLLTDDPSCADRVRNLRDAPYDFPEPAIWLPYTDLQASMVLTQWDRLPQFLKRRNELAQYYLDNLPEALRDCVLPAMRAPDTTHFRFVLRMDDPQAFIDEAAKLGVAFRKPVAPMPLHELFSIDGEYPATDDAMVHNVSLPLYPELTDEEAARVCEVASDSFHAVSTVRD